MKDSLFNLGESSVSECLDDDDEVRRGPPFRSNIEHLHAPFDDFLLNPRRLIGCQRAVQARRIDFTPNKRVDLVAHKRDERRDDQGQALNEML